MSKEVKHIKEEKRPNSPILKETLPTNRDKDFSFDSIKEEKHELFFRVYNEKNSVDKYEAGMYFFDDKGVLYDLVFENQRVSNSYNIKDENGDDKKSIPSVEYESNTNEIRSKHHFKIQFQTMYEDIKYLVVYLRSTRGQTSFSKGSPELRIDFHNKEKTIYRDQKECKGEHTCMILGIFICTNRNVKDAKTTWRFASLDTKTSWIYITESLQKIYTDLENVKEKLEKEKGKEYLKKNVNDYLNPKKVFQEFRVRKGHEINFAPKQKQFYVKFKSTVMAEEFDIDLSVLLYDDRGFLLNYCFADKEEAGDKNFVNTIGSLELPNESMCSINFNALEKDSNLSNTKYIVFCLTLYQSNTYNFLWVASNSIEVYEDKKDQVPLFKMDLDKSFKTAIITSMMYKDEDGIWNFRAIDRQELASDFVDLLDIIRGENLVPKKPIIGVQEMGISGTLDRLDIPRDELLYIKFRHNNYKRENLEKLYLIVYDNRGFVLKFEEVSLINKDQYGATDPWIEYNLFNLVKNKDENWTIVGVLVGQFPRGTDLSLVFYDSKKTKVHFQMSLRTELYFETDQPHEKNYYSCFPFQLIQKPKEGGVYLWTAKCEGICTSQNSPGEWYPMIKSHILRDLMGRRNLFSTILKPESKPIDEYSSVVIGIQCKKKVSIVVSGYDHSGKELPSIVSENGSKSYRYNDLEKDKEIIKLLRTEVSNWYETKKDTTELVVQGEGDQAQVVFQKLDNFHPFRMISFGIYFPSEKDDVTIKIYGCTSETEYEILFQQEIKTNLSEKSSPFEKEVASNIDKSKENDLFVPLMMVRNNIDVESGEIKGDERDWKIAFLYTRNNEIREQKTNQFNGIKLPATRSNPSFVIESIKCKGLNISETFIKGMIESQNSKSEFSTQIISKTKDPEFKEVYVLNAPFDWSKSTLKLQIFEAVIIVKDNQKETEPKLYGEVTISAMHLIPQQFGKYKLFPIMDKNNTKVGDIGLNFRFQKKMEEKTQ